MPLYKCSKCLKPNPIIADKPPQRCSKCRSDGVYINEKINDGMEVKLKRIKKIIYPSPIPGFNEYLACMDDQKMKKEDPNFISSGGISGNGVSIFAGQSNAGKTIFLIQFAKILVELGKKILCVVTEHRAITRYQNELADTPGITLLDAQGYNIEEIRKEINKYKPDILMLDSLGETRVILQSHGALAGMSANDAQKGTSGQTGAAIAFLEEINKKFGIPVYATHQVTREDKNVLAGPFKVIYRCDDIFLINISDLQDTDDQEAKSPYREIKILKRTNSPVIQKPYLVEISKERGWVQDLIPNAILNDLMAAENYTVGTAIVGSLEKFNFKKIILEEVQVYERSQTQRVQGTSVSSVTKLKACMEKLRINGDNLDFYQKNLNNPLSDLGILAGIYSHQKGVPLGPCGIFFGEVDTDGHVKPFSCDPWMSKITLPFENRIVGNLSRTGGRYPLFNGGNLHIQHIQELPERCKQIMEVASKIRKSNNPDQNHEAA